MQSAKLNPTIFLRLLAATVCLGVLGGVVGAGFSLGISFVTALRTSNGWLIFLLPFCGIFITYIYQKASLTGVGVNNVLLACEAKERLSPALSFVIFISSALSHLCGASVGREGAALQIGGSLSSVVGDFFALNKNQSKILLRVGLVAVFAAVFGTPLAAFFFALEVVTVGALHLKSTFFCLIASFAGYFTSVSLGAHPERFSPGAIPSFSLPVLWKVALLTVLTAILSIVFCVLLRYSSAFAKKIFKNAYLRAISGGAVIVILTVLLNTGDYNGAGISVIEDIFDSGLNPDSLSFHPEAFALKLIFTCVSVSAGYKGGEIVPTLFIGATFGALIATLTGLPIAFGAALGMVLLFCGVTNCPLASIFLGLEMFTGVGIWYFIPTVALCFILSGKISLYSAQEHKFRFL